ncbi:hypothetical protein [Paenibacillus sinopodophylli]|uniref:hypothetical protein n=1 Tax=Paenibacillus sinopodophylli TaxID=1837342 RepID=UPI00110CD15B|nr:hypothetical protein [Paenibacillus sinopodophylli]
MNQKIALISLAFSYFKGLIDFKLEADGEDVDVYGDNAAGKTTLFDGFSYLLFDKDSRDKAQPEKWIKTLNQEGIPIQDGKHQIEGVLLINGKTLTLRKVFSEKWTKKRGSAIPEFSGHDTKYFFNGAELKQGEYKAEIARIIDEDTFKLLTNPTYFNEVYDKNKRRKLLLEMCGDLADEHVIASNPDLQELPSLLGDSTLDLHRNYLKTEQKRINSEINNIPVSITAIQRAMPAINGADEKTLEVQLKSIRSRIAGKEEEFNRLQSGGEVAVQENRKHELQGELLQLKNSIQSGTLDKVNAQRSELSKLQGKQSEIETEFSRTSRDHSENVRIIDGKNAEREKLREKYVEVQAQEFAHTGSDDCPSCGQALPSEKVDEAHQKALQAFNAGKSLRLEQIRADGHAAKDLVERLGAQNEKLAVKRQQLNEQMAEGEKSISKTKSALAALEANIQDVDTNPEYIAKKQEMADVEAQIVSIRTSNAGMIGESRLELVNLRMEADKLERERGAYAATAKSREEIASLKEREKQLAREYEGLERQVYLTDEFIRTKVTLLESKINSMFRNVRFKLFNTLVNGSLEEVCETLYGPNLVPYSGGLNRAAQLNSGLDIIETLSIHRGVSAPIFIDNAEAVTELVKTTGQQIRLIVSKSDKLLRVENAGNPNAIIVDNEVIA